MLMAHYWEQRLGLCGYSHNKKQKHSNSKLTVVWHVWTDRFNLLWLCNNNNKHQHRPGTQTNTKDIKVASSRCSVKYIQA